MAGIHGEASLRALERAVRDALPAWSLPPATRVDLLNISENVTFALHDRQNDRRLVLRVHRPGYHSEAEIRSELAWITALREQAVIATPAPITTAYGGSLYPLNLWPCQTHHQSDDFVMAGLDPAIHDFLSQAQDVDARVNPSVAIPTAPPSEPWPPPPGHDEKSASKLHELIGLRYAVAFEYLSGREPGRDENLPETFRILGTITAQMHSHARAWTRPAGFVRKTCNFRTMLGDHALWGDWRAGPGLDSIGSALLQRAAECLCLRLARFGTQPDRFGLIHADLRLANLLIDGDVLNVIDFDDCGFGWFAYDFAASVSFIEDDPAVPELLAAWLEGYRTVASFAREDEAEIPAFVMLRRLLLLAWIGSHAEAPTAQALGSTYAAGTLALADDFLRRYG